MLKEQSLIDISKLLRISPPLRPCNIPISVSELERILDGIKNWKKPKNYKPIGEPPQINNCPSESKTGYRRKISEFVELNTDGNIKLPVMPGIPSIFYNQVLKKLKLYKIKKY